MSKTAIDKILELLATGNYDTNQIAKELKMPLGTVRSTLSLLARLGLVIQVPEQKHGVPYTITEKGRGELQAKEVDKK